MPSVVPPRAGQVSRSSGLKKTNKQKTNQTNKQSGRGRILLIVESMGKLSGATFSQDSDLHFPMDKLPVGHYGIQKSK